MLTELFKELGLSVQESESYLNLLEQGQISVGELAKRCNTPRTTLYGHLLSLSEVGLVKKTSLDGIIYWQSEDPKYLLKLAEQKVRKSEQVAKSIADIIPSLVARKKTNFQQPKFTYLEGPKGVRQILRDILLYRDIQTEAFWPIGEMLQVIGEDFLAEHNAQRIRQNISIRAIWPEKRAVSIDKNPFLGVGEDFLREIRVAPEDIDCSMAYWIYGNKVAFTSSKKECYGFIVESPEFVEMQRSQFDFVFSRSKKLVVKSQKPEKFLLENGLKAI